MKSGFILVGNHTQPLDSAFASVFVASPKRNYVMNYPLYAKAFYSTGANYDIKQYNKKRMSSSARNRAF